MLPQKIMNTPTDSASIPQALWRFFWLNESSLTQMLACLISFWRLKHRSRICDPYHAMQKATWRVDMILFKEFDAVQTINWGESESVHLVYCFCLPFPCTRILHFIRSVDQWCSARKQQQSLRSWCHIHLAVSWRSCSCGKTPCKFHLWSYPNH